MISRPLSTAVLALLFLTGCAPMMYARRQAPAPGRHLIVSARQIAELSDREYLMRKATIGSRTERIEALDVIDRTNDSKYFTFLLERLAKEDDRFIQIRIMHALANTGDVRAIPKLRSYAIWDPGRIGIEATVALYELGDDAFVPLLVQKLRNDEENPEISGIAHRALRKMTSEELPASRIDWMNYWRTHRLAKYEANPWYWPFYTSLPPTTPGTTKVANRPKGKIPLPNHDVHMRHTNVTLTDFWKAEQ